MRKGLIVLISIYLLGCERRDPFPTPETTVVEGLEIELIEITIPSVISSIDFTSELTGYAGARNGLVYKTTNGGESWSEFQTNNTFPITSIQFLNESEGWALLGDKDCVDDVCMPSPAILHTENGGQNWETLDPKLLKATPQAIHFVNFNLGFVVGSNFILRTKDGGTSWDETKFEDLATSMWSVQFFDEQHGIVSCWQKKILVTSNGGDTWDTLSPFDPNANRYSPSLVANTAFMSSSNALYTSSDYGQTWTKLTDINFGIDRLAFNSETTGFACGIGDHSGGDFGRFYASLYYTRDGGQSWKGTSTFHEIGPIRTSSFPSPTTFYATDGGTFVRIKFK